MLSLMFFSGNLQNLLKKNPLRSVCFSAPFSKMADSQEKKIKLRFKNPVVWIDLEVCVY